MSANTAAQLDLDAVEKYLTANLPGFKGPIELHKFSVGQSNPTFRLTTPSGGLCAASQTTRRAAQIRPCG